MPVVLFIYISSILCAGETETEGMDATHVMTPILNVHPVARTTMEMTIADTESRTVAMDTVTPIMMKDTTDQDHDRVSFL